MIRFALRTLAATLVIIAAAPAIAGAQPRPDRRELHERGLEISKEELAVRGPSERSRAVPGGDLEWTAQILASFSDVIRVDVRLDRAAPGERLVVELPTRVAARSEVSGIRYTEAPSGRTAQGRADVRTAGDAATLAFQDARAGDVVGFSIRDIGLPAGTYALPWTWRSAADAVVARGTIDVAVLARSRESLAAEEGGGAAERRQRQLTAWAKLYAPGAELNATDDGSNESETFITVVPGDRQRLIIGANGGGGFNAWLSQNAGATFEKLSMPALVDAPGKAGAETGSLCCDPMSAADQLGNIWYGGLTLANGAANPSRIVVNRIAAGGGSFRAQTVGLGTRTSGTQDKPMMTIDNSSSSPTYGRLYVVWNEPASGGGINVVLASCDTVVLGAKNAARCDDADNWTAPVSVTPSPGGYIYADVAISPDGRVNVVWWDYSATNAIRGRTCDPATTECVTAPWGGSLETIATLDGTGGPVPFACPILAQPGGRASTAPNIETDISSGPDRGRIYVTWSDLATGTGSTRCADSTAPALTHLTFDSFVASAADALPGGASPSASVATRLITDGEGGAAAANADDWFPWLAVDQTTGQAWADLYSTRDDATRKTTNFYVRTVTPSAGGHTLGGLTKVSGQPSDYSGSPCCGFGNDYGDYTGIDATGGLALPVWSDKRAGSDGEAFTFGDAVLPVAAATAVGGGDADGVLEPGEYFTLPQNIRNAGTATLAASTAAVASLSPDLVVRSAAVPYPAITGGATLGPTGPIVGGLKSAAACSGSVSLRLTLQAPGGYQYVVPVTLPVGSGGPPAAVSVSPAAAIPDNSATGVSSTVNVDSAGTIFDIDAGMTITHTYDADLTIRLIGPDATSVVLAAGAGASGDNFTGTVFDDGAATPITAGAAPFTGGFRPLQALSAFTGKAAAGNWTLKIIDGAAGDAGVLQTWSMTRREPTCSSSAVNQAPTAAISVSPAGPAAGAAVMLDASGSTDPESAIAAYDWDLDGDGSFETAGGANPQLQATFAAGDRTVAVRVADELGLTSAAATTFSVQGAVGPAEPPAEAPGTGTTPSAPPAVPVTRAPSIGALKVVLGRLRVPVTVAGAGTIRVRVTAKVGGRTITVAQGTATRSTAGRTTLRLRLTRRATGALTRLRRLRVTVSATFAPEGRAAAVATKRATLSRARR